MMGARGMEGASCKVASPCWHCPRFARFCGQLLVGEHDELHGSLGDKPNVVSGAGIKSMSRGREDNAVYRQPSSRRDGLKITGSRMSHTSRSWEVSVSLVR